MDDTILTGRGKPCPIRRPGHGLNLVCMTAIGHNALIRNAPYLHSFVPGIGYKAPAIRRPSQCMHLFEMGTMEETVAIGDIPHMEHPILSPGGECCAIGRPSNHVDLVR